VELKTKRTARAAETNRGGRAVIERLRSRIQASGKFAGPCLPALADHYLARFEQLFASIERPFDAAELQAFRRVFMEKLAEGFSESPHARFVLEYRPSASRPSALDCGLSIFVPTLEEQYEDWLEGQAADEPFGLHADAMVLEVARRSSATTGNLSVLDLGAGNGRNTLPLARAGAAVTAVEPVAALSQRIGEAKAREQLAIELVAGDVLDPGTKFPEHHYDLIVISEVFPHFSRAEFETVLVKMAGCLRPSGTLLFNAFLAAPGYTPDPVARQAAQSVWSTFLTQAELDAALGAHGLTVATRADCVAYEKAHLPDAAWPPTAWYENWASGRNLFGAVLERPPIRLTWLECRRQAG
jgi:SAM-dependent methyltransferase